MNLGFTGTREPLANAQLLSLGEWLKRQTDITQFLHGACVGADATATLLVKGHFGRLVEAHAYPGHIPSMTSEPAMSVSAIRHPPAHTLSRNRAIVEACDLLLACPKGPEEPRSGTWATVRYARKLGRPIVVIWPDGRVYDSREVES